ncbi:MAG: ROK family protein [Ruminococcaceae bacterium]|nr:ROK family protein [Oscillospiraceae bacterium]
MYRIGVDLGGTNIAIGIVDGENNIVKKGSVPTNAGRNPDEIVKDIAKLTTDLLKEMDILPCRIELLGIASPGAIDPVNGVVSRATNLGMVDYPLVAKLRELLPIKNIKIENDANAAALGEAVAGSGKGVDKFIMVTLGTGVGGGIIIDGKIYSGFNYAGGELGHMVIEHNGRQCGCGRRGCWETYSSATGLINITKEYMINNRNSIMWKMVDGDIDKVSGKTAYKAASMGDMTARAVCAEYTDYLACGLVNIINIFQPNIISIGGGVSNEGENLMAPLCELVDKLQFTSAATVKTELRLAELKNDAGIIGAASI